MAEMFGKGQKKKRIKEEIGIFIDFCFFLK